MANKRKPTRKSPKVEEEVLQYLRKLYFSKIIASKKEYDGYYEKLGNRELWFRLINQASEESKKLPLMKALE